MNILSEAWEVIGSGPGSNAKLSRLSVPGGWLVVLSDPGAQVKCMSFVSDVDHLWGYADHVEGSARERIT